MSAAAVTVLTVRRGVSLAGVAVTTTTSAAGARTTRYGISAGSSLMSPGWPKLGFDLLSDLFILRGVPAHIRSDNGPEFVAKAVQESIGIACVKKVCGSMC